MISRQTRAITGARRPLRFYVRLITIKPRRHELNGILKDSQEIFKTPRGTTILKLL